MARLVAVVLALVVPAATYATPPYPNCRCLPRDACWATVDWMALNASVDGRLVRSIDPMAPCFGAGIGSGMCTAALSRVDDEFWISDQPSGYQHTGLYGTCVSLLPCCSLLPSFSSSSIIPKSKILPLITPCTERNVRMRRLQ